MNAARVGPVRLGADAGAQTARATLTLGNAEKELWFRVRGAPLRPAPEAFLAAALLPAMSRGWPLAVADPLSERLRATHAALQRVYRAFEPHLALVPLEAAGRAGGARAAGVGLFFSGGVDGFHGLVSRQAEVTQLILVHGLDYPLEDRALGAQVGARIEAVARAVGKALVQVETNFHAVVAPFAVSRTRTPMQATLGAALGGIAALLAGAVGRVYVPSSASAATLTPFGSHPLVDPLWSTEEVEVVHDGLDVNRYEKAVAIAGFAPAYAALRPCGTNAGGAYNCGRCQKCAATMLMLAAAGGLERFTVFPTGLEAAIRAWPIRASLRPQPAHWYLAIQDAVEALTAGGPESRALRRLLRGRTWIGRWHHSRLRRGVRRLLLRAVRRRARRP